MVWVVCMVVIKSRIILFILKRWVSQTYEIFIIIIIIIIAKENMKCEGWGRIIIRGAYCCCFLAELQDFDLVVPIDSKLLLGVCLTISSSSQRNLRSQGFLTIPNRCSSISSQKIIKCCTSDESEPWQKFEMMA